MVNTILWEARSSMPILFRRWQEEDLRQEILLKVLQRRDHYTPGRSFYCWAETTARNHLIHMARMESRRPDPHGELEAPATGGDPAWRSNLRASTRDLLAWLKENPGDVPEGWKVFNLLLWTGGNYPYVAMAMSVNTGHPWTEERVRRLVDRIKQTPVGLTLCQDLGLHPTTPTTRKES